MGSRLVSLLFIDEPKILVSHRIINAVVGLLGKTGWTGREDDNVTLCFSGNKPKEPNSKQYRKSDNGPNLPMRPLVSQVG